MKIQSCPQNIRCDCISCNKFAKYSIDTSSYKGNLNLCEECFKKLLDAAMQMKKEITKINEVHNEKRKK